MRKEPPAAIRLDRLVVPVAASVIGIIIPPGLWAGKEQTGKILRVLRVDLGWGPEAGPDRIHAHGMAIHRGWLADPAREIFPAGNQGLDRGAVIPLE